MKNGYTTTNLSKIFTKVKWVFMTLKVPVYFIYCIAIGFINVLFMLFFDFSLHTISWTLVFCRTIFAMRSNIYYSYYAFVITLCQ